MLQLTQIKIFDKHHVTTLVFNSRRYTTGIYM